MKRSMPQTLLLAVLCAVLCSGCALFRSNGTDEMPPVKNFEVDRYLGTWYEIARLPNRFEKDLHHVTASYISGNKSNEILIENRGSVDGKTFKSVEGIARFARGRNVGVFRVSFQWPFYGTYRILELDPGYRTALVCGDTTDYLWILSRTPRMDDATLARLIQRAKVLGFATDKLIFTVHAAK